LARARNFCGAFLTNKFDVDKLIRIESPSGQQVIDKLAVFFVAYIQADCEEMDASVQRASVALRGGCFMKTLMLLSLAALLIGCRTNETPRAQVDDLQITTQLKTKLASDVGISSVTDISINTTNGVVTLSGIVDSADAKSKAEGIAKEVPKVVRVVNNLQVAPKAQTGT
jgi:hypothetical protein